MKTKGSMWKSGYRKWVWWVLGFTILVVGGVVLIRKNGNLRGGQGSFPWEIETGAYAKLGDGAPMPPAENSPRITAENTAEVVGLAMAGNGYPIRTTWSPDGRYFLVTTSIGVDVYDTQTYQKQHSLRSTAPINSMVFSPDGAYLALGSEGRVIYLWRLADGTLERTLEGTTAGQNRILAIAFSTDGKYLLGWVERLHIWEVESGKILVDFHSRNRPISAILFTPEQGKLVGLMGMEERIGFGDPDEEAGSGIELQPQEIPSVDIGMGSIPAYAVWDLGSGEELRRVEENHESLDEILDTYLQGTITVLQAAEGDILEDKTPIYQGNRVISDDQLFVVCFLDEGRVQFLDNSAGNTREPEVLYELDVFEKWVEYLSISPDDGSVGILYSDRTIDVWRPAAGVVNTIQEYEDVFLGVDILPQTGEWFEESEAQELKPIDQSVDGSVRFWQARGGSLVVSGNWIPEDAPLVPYTNMAFSKDGQWLAMKKGLSIRVWWMPEGVLEADLSGSPSVFMPGIVFSPDGSIVVTDYEKYRGSSSDPGIYGVQMLRVADGEMVRFYQTGSRVMSLAISPDGSLVAAGELEKRITVWRDGKPATWVTPDVVLSLAFSPDGSFLAANGDVGSIYLWDTETGELIGVFGTEYTFSENSLAFSPDGRILAAGGDGSVFLWQVVDGQLLVTLEGHTMNINSLAFSPGGDVLASTSRDGTMRLWGVP